MVAKNRDDVIERIESLLDDARSSLSSIEYELADFTNEKKVAVSAPVFSPSLADETELLTFVAMSQMPPCTKCYFSRLIQEGLLP